MRFRIGAVLLSSVRSDCGPFDPPSIQSLGAVTANSACTRRAWLRLRRVLSLPHSDLTQPLVPRPQPWEKRGTFLPSPTIGVTTPPASGPPPRSHVSSAFCFSHPQPVSNPIAVTHSPGLVVPTTGANTAPTTAAATHSPLWYSLAAE